MDERLVIRGGRPLQGSIVASGSKNAALYALAATLLTADPVTIHNTPAIADIGEMADLLRALGARVERSGDDVEIQAAELTEHRAPDEHVVALRASFLVMGPLLAREGEAACAAPGGDVIGVRPLDVHLTGFRALGAEVVRNGAAWVARAPRLTGARLFLDYPSVLGTVNLLFAATLARGTTTIVNAAAEPEVQMVAEMLNEMGARIRGHGSNTIEVDGVERLHGTEFTVIPDRIESGTFLLAGAATGGDVTVEGANPRHLDSLLTKMNEAGLDVTAAGAGIRVCRRPGHDLKPIQLQAVPYPGYATDLHAPMAAMLTQAHGVSIVLERVFENRLLYVGELRSMGAHITAGGQSVMIEGPTPLFGANVRALDVRAGAAVVIAGLAASGETSIRDVIHLDRGYAGLSGRLRALGADVNRI
ncbi:MAG: UDP-N-acetylglucosamine 1-carboxyvinyltransferase [Dehalococcoidia bacterium]|jgi:UDP-N-acetylglucosamine 1-carboxyvinyltransferase|nr:UDP-N-acetylglucosamine 1-carboxyvinyltransferase [Dehalococcoidia bacterium]